MGVFNGILTSQCKEIALPTRGYDSVVDLYKEEDTSGEIGLCNLAAIVAGRVSEEELPELYYYTLLMVDNVISHMDYPFPNLKFTAQARRSVAIGITNLANHMARNGMRYSTNAGKEFAHRLAEQHSYLLHRASLEISKEKGVCSWMDRTKYPEGWLPIDTYNKNVDKVVSQELIYDWKSLRKEIIDNGGIRNSVLEGYMPNESSSIATNGTNSILPVRSLKVVKTNAGNTTKFIAPDYEEFGSNYEIAWDIPSKHLIDIYAIFQKFCGQAISADLYVDQSTGTKVSEASLLTDWMRMTMLGVKTRYYVNTKTSSGDKEDKGSASEIEMLDGEDKGCSSGGCSI
jgi:ribonucleoside-diphosphate reductase alpha chain